MKKVIRSAAAVALMSLVVASCNKQAPKVDEKPATASAANTEMKIAYIEVDSIMSQYKFCKEYSAILEKKGQNIQNTISSKGRSLQNAVAKFQQDIQNNKYTQQQAEAVQAGLQKQDADLDKKYSLILSKAGDNILYADKAYDITNEVISGLNKAYKSVPAAKKK